jgi:hypothetical protein
MIKKILGAISTIFVYTCVATVLSQAILAVYFARAWHVNRERLARTLAVAQGVDLDALKEKTQAQSEIPSIEQASYAEILEARAVKTRQLELREQALRSGTAQLQTELTKLLAQQKHYQLTKNSFQAQLATTQQGATATGQEDARRTLENIKPKQAKELFAGMLEQKEMDAVVSLIAAMPDAKRAKIIAEFKTPSELEQVNEILRRIRAGAATATAAAAAQKQLAKAPTPGS